MAEGGLPDRQHNITVALSQHSKKLTKSKRQRATPPLPSECETLGTQGAKEVTNLHHTCSLGVMVAESGIPDRQHNITAAHSQHSKKRTKSKRPKRRVKRLML